MKAMVTAGLLAALALSGEARAADAPGYWWLEGDWTATGGGAPGQAGGGFSFHREAGGRVLVRRSLADYPAQGGRPAQRHEDLMVIYRDGEWAKATYWDSEGQIIHYQVAKATPDEVVFLGDGSAGGPAFRLTYRKTTEGLEGRFEVAPPPTRDQFQTYLTWTAVRAK